jgi:hypothetical protein
MFLRSINSLFAINDIIAEFCSFVYLFTEETRIKAKPITATRISTITTIIVMKPSWLLF